MDNKKYLIDASIIASSLEDFKRRYIGTECTLVLSDLTLKELENRKKDRGCATDSKKFVSFLIDWFVRNNTSTEVCIIEYDSSSKHIDTELVKYAKSNDISVLTCDKAMALWCRFYEVECQLLEVRSSATLPFVFENDGVLHLNLRKVPIGYSTYVYSPESNKIMSPLDNGVIFLNPGNIILVAHSADNACCIDTYFISKDMDMSLIGKDIYSSSDDIDTDSKPLHLNLYYKWHNHNFKRN